VTGAQSTAVQRRRLRPPVLSCAAAIIAAALPAVTFGASETSVAGADGIVLALDAAAGRYEVRSFRLHWVFAGSLGGAASNLQVHDGADRLGAFRELEFAWPQPSSLKGSIRAYREHPLLLFTVTTTAAIADAAVMRFPRFTEFPGGLHGFSYATHEFAPPRFDLEQNGTPWLLYDERAHAAVLSPAANFMIASLYGDGKTQIASGLNGTVGALPGGFSHSSLLALGRGINATWETWGRALTALEGAQRPANDADAALRYLGYWTDNGAAYYYDYDRQLGYAGTLLALVRRYREERIPIRYLQLDSWWYSKSRTDPDGRTGKRVNERLPDEAWSRFGGLLEYTAHPSLFPDGLAEFQRQVGLALITHNRWIDPASPYHERYRISGYAALDPAWWHDVMAYLAAANVVTYEQDWLNVIYDHSPELAADREAGSAFTDGMANAARDAGLTLQYCMPEPRHFLQGARYANLTTIRVSGDRLERDKWDAFLYTSRLASALQIWPWTDVFMSRETDNLLIATLSAGMVGIGDRLGEEDKSALLRAVRADGVIVKPDTPLVPLDGMYTASADRPMLAAAHTAHGALRSSYVFAYARSPAAAGAAFTPAEVGVPQPALVYDARRGVARRLAAQQRFSFALAGGASAYFIVVPRSRSGIALLGDAGLFVPDGRKRIAALEDARERLTATIIFAPQESSVRLFGYAPHRPAVTAEIGRVDALEFDERTGRFEVQIFPGVEPRTEQPGNDPVRRAMISLASRS